MNIPPFIPILASFSVAFGLTVWWKGSTPSAGLPPGLPPQPSLALQMPGDVPVPPPQPQELAALLALPPSEQHDQRLQDLCTTLLASDPEAAFRAGMARWEFDSTALKSAARALIKVDPAAARRLLADCPDLRSRSLLESCLMADEVSRNPREKIRWAEAQLDGDMRAQALAEGAAALAALDPEEALTFAAELAPSEVALQIMKNSLAGKLRQDPLSAVQWMTDHVPAAKMTEVGYHLFSKYAETHPDQARSLLPQLPDHLKNTMLEAILEHGIKDLTDPRQIYANSIQTIQSFPEDLRIPAWRMFLWGHGNEENGRFSGDLLNAATSPAERAVVVEKLAWTNIANFEGGLTPENLAFLQQFETPEDKQSAARVVPFLGLTETRQQDILNRLK